MSQTRYTLVSGSDFCKNECFNHKYWGCISFLRSLAAGKNCMDNDIIKLYDPNKEN